MTAAGIAFNASRHERCPSSGWQLALGCTDGHGHGVCPTCEQTVAVAALSSRSVRLAPHTAEPDRGDTR